MQNQDWTQAEIAMRKAVDLNPRDGNQIHNYGWMQCQQKHFDVAQQWFDRALQAPGYREQPRTLLAKGMCYQQAGPGWSRPTRTCFVRDGCGQPRCRLQPMANVLWLKVI